MYSTLSMLTQFILLICFCNIFFNNHLISGHVFNHNNAERDTASKSNLLPVIQDIMIEPIHESESNQELKDRKYYDALEHWTGRWMPENNPVPTPAPDPLEFTVDMHRPIQDINPECDDGKNNLDVDWNNSPVNYTCYYKQITPSYLIPPKWYCEHVSPFYQPQQLCMKHTIEYDDDIPIYGPHRPVMPVYGEYKFLPRQRWLNSLRHGAVVMLYDPCVNPLELRRLKDLVQKCLQRHIITAHNLMDDQRPLALVTWGCRLTMSYVNTDLVKNFIKTNALHGPEFTSDDGKFMNSLLREAKPVSDNRDSLLCPLL